MTCKFVGVASVSFRFVSFRFVLFLVLPTSSGSLGRLENNSQGLGNRFTAKCALATFQRDQFEPLLDLQAYFSRLQTQKMTPWWHMWPAERKPSTSRKYWIRVRGNFIRTGRFPAKLRLLHQGVTEGLHCIILNYEARLGYYKDAISLNSQAGQWKTGARCYGQLKHAFS